MLTPEGHWMSPPPIYPPIKTKGIYTNIRVNEIIIKVLNIYDIGIVNERSIQSYEIWESDMNYFHDFLNKKSLVR